jgi:hypothetical protein
MRERTNGRFEVAISYIQRLAKQDTSSWNPQWQATRHECTMPFLKQTSLECVVRKHANSRTSHNFKVYPSARKLTESVFWSHLCCSQWGHTSNGTRCDECVRLLAERDLLMPWSVIRQRDTATPQRARRLTGTSGSSTPLVLALNQYPHSFEPYDNNQQKADSTIKRKWKGCSWMVANAKPIFICHDPNFKPVPKCDKFNNVPGD